MRNVAVASDANKLANPALLSIFSARLLLKMKEASRTYFEQRPESSSQGIVVTTVRTTMSEIVFTSPQASVSESVARTSDCDQDDVHNPNYDERLDP